MAEPGTLAATLDIFSHTTRLNRWIVDRLRPWSGRRLVELGAGLGTITALLAEAADEVVATESDSMFLDGLRARFAQQPNVVVERLDLDNITPSELVALRARRPDTVVAVNVLEHVRNDRAALRSLRELVSPGGRLLLYLPALRWLHGSLDRGLGHQRRYERRTIEERLVATGWRLLHLSWMNLAGIAGWFVNSRILRRAALSPCQVALYDRLTPFWRFEERLRPRFGMSLIVACERAA